jgi:small-conductance mechanosensitive channel
MLGSAIAPQPDASVLARIHRQEKPMNFLAGTPVRLHQLTLTVMSLTGLLWAASLSGGAAAADAPALPAAAEEAAEIVAAPVVVDGIALLRVRGISAFPADKRAEAIAGRIEALAADRGFSPGALRIEEAEGTSRILAGNQLVMIVSDADARLEQVDRQVLASALVKRIGEAIETYRRDRGTESLVRSGLLALAASVALAVLLWLGRLAMRRLDALFERRIKRKLAGLEAQSFRILSAAHLWRTLKGLRGLLWTVAVLLAIVVYLDFILQLFPWTRWLGVRMFDVLVEPLGVVGAGLLGSIPDLVFLAILVIVVRYVLKALHMLFGGIEQGIVSFTGFEREWALPTYRLVRLMVIALAVVVAYPYIPGSETDAFKGVSLFLGVVFSLGSSSLIGNIIAGYSMTYRRAFRVGDRVRIDEHTGDVAQTRLLVTHLRTPKNEEIVIPNSTILATSVINYSSLAREGRLILHTTVGIGYETPWRQVEAMLREAAARTEGLLKEPAPFVLQKALGDFAVTYEINAYCGDAQAMATLYTRLHRSILDVFNEYGVQIMTPAYEGDPDQPKIVPKEQWHAAPAAAPESAPR